VSRFVRQLEAETDIEMNHRNIASEVIVEDPNVISIEKNKEIMDQLINFTSRSGFQKRLTPTAINTYLDCRLKFYYKYVLGLKEQDEMAEEVDADGVWQYFAPRDGAGYTCNMISDGHRQVTEPGY
jgi:hypothetical protein